MSSTLRLLRFVCLAACLATPTAGGQQAPTSEVLKDHPQRARLGLQLFREHIRPLLSQHCVKCHGGKTTKADFDLATREALFASGYVGATAAESHLLLVIRHQQEPHMPLDADKLPDQDIARIGRWIDLGAPYDKPLIEGRSPTKPAARQITDEDRSFWSFRRLGHIAQPAVEQRRWPRNGLDQFLLARLEAAGLRPAAAADRRTLIRRASLDLLGLPPAPGEVDGFVRDSRPDAYDRLIDRLLNSPQYGERWARHWLDVARFAESSGFEHDTDRATAYHYRDFLIEAFNEDIPWDDMVRWQVAGDELHADHRLAARGTGFLAAGVFPTQLTEAEFESARYDELDDMIGTLGVAFLGLSTGCARCHDHKYDPIPSHDYYRLAAVFAATIRAEQMVNVDQRVFREQRDRWERQRNALERSWKQAANQDKRRWQQKIEAHRQREPRDGKLLAMVSTEGVKPLKHNADGRGYPHTYPHVYFLNRGDPRQKHGVAAPGLLQVLTRRASEPHQLPMADAPAARLPHLSYRRTRLARWLTDHQRGAGHLLARVIVNRVWQHHFGRGIVATPNDFGMRGARPTHPELLDWLAGELVRHGWQLKWLHRLIMTSATYRQASALAEDPTTDAGQIERESAARTIDLENRLLWRYPARRLTAEAIRDALLVVAQQMDRTMYGPGSLDQAMRRRSVYFTIKRSRPIPLMQVFDWPEHLVSIGRRSETTIAPQALSLLNSPQVRQFAESLAQRVQLQAAASRSAMVELAYQTVFNRDPTCAETARAIEFVQRQTDRYAGSAAAMSLAVIDLCHALMSSNEFLYLP